jgi:predicted Zn-dependent peptidase
MVTAGIEFENKEIAEKAIFDQLDAMKRGDITEEEFLSAKRSLRNAFMQVYDSPRAMEKWALNRTFFGSILTLKEECARIECATVNDVVEFAKRITLDTVYFLKGESIDG